SRMQKVAEPSRRGGAVTEYLARARVGTRSTCPRGSSRAGQPRVPTATTPGAIGATGSGIGRVARAIGRPGRGGKNFEVALLESRPEGAATCQPRAPPWELDRVLSVELFRPFRAGRILIRIGSPGRCPGLFCFGPFGAPEKRNTKTRLAGSARPNHGLTAVVTGHGLRYPVEISENSQKTASQGVFVV